MSDTGIKKGDHENGRDGKFKKNDAENMEQFTGT